jgi:hypothetical protein
METSRQPCVVLGFMLSEPAEIFSPATPCITGIATDAPYGSKGRLAVRFVESRAGGRELLRNDFDSAKSRTHLFRDNPRFAGRVTLLDRIQWFSGPIRPSDNHAWLFWNANHTGAPTVSYAERV